MVMNAEYWCETCDVFDFTPHEHAKGRPDCPTCGGPFVSSVPCDCYPKGYGLRPGKQTILIGRNFPPKHFSIGAANVSFPDLNDEGKPVKVLNDAELKAVEEIQARRKKCVLKAKKALERWMEGGKDVDLEDAVDAMKREDALDTVQMLIEEPEFFEDE